MFRRLSLSTLPVQVVSPSSCSCLSSSLLHTARRIRVKGTAERESPNQKEPEEKKSQEENFLTAHKIRMLTKEVEYWKSQAQEVPSGSPTHDTELMLRYEKVTDSACEWCFAEGHSARFCPEKYCTNCGRKGHKEWDCSQPRVSQKVRRINGEARARCTTCGVVGHVAKDCERYTFRSD